MSLGWTFFHPFLCRNHVLEMSLSAFQPPFCNISMFRGVTWTTGCRCVGFRASAWYLSPFLREAVGRKKRCQSDLLAWPYILLSNLRSSRWLGVLTSAVLYAILLQLMGRSRCCPQDLVEVLSTTKSAEQWANIFNIFELISTKILQYHQDKLQSPVPSSITGRFATRRMTLQSIACLNLSTSSLSTMKSLRLKTARTPELQNPTSASLGVESGNPSVVIAALPPCTRGTLKSSREVVTASFPQRFITLPIYLWCVMW